jgi:hypothetical protein
MEHFVGKHDQQPFRQVVLEESSLVASSSVASVSSGCLLFEKYIQTDRDQVLFLFRRHLFFLSRKTLPRGLAYLDLRPRQLQQILVFEPVLTLRTTRRGASFIGGFK